MITYHGWRRHSLMAAERARAFLSQLSSTGDGSRLSVEYGTRLPTMLGTGDLPHQVHKTILRAGGTERLTTAFSPDYRTPRGRLARCYRWQFTMTFSGYYTMNVHSAY